MIALAEWTSWLIWSALVVLGVGLGALYAGLETGIYVLNKIRLDLRAEAGSAPARILHRHLGDSDNLLAVLLVGTNVCGYVTTFAISAMFVLAGAAQRAEWYTLAVATPLMFLFRESVPKNVFQRLAERLVYRFAWLLAVSSAVFNLIGLAPLVRGFSRLVMRLLPFDRRRRGRHQGLDAIMAEGAACGLLTHFQSLMAYRVMNIADVRLAQVMTPMPRVVSASRDVTAQEFLSLLRGHDYRRVPLLDRHGQVVGIVDIYDVLTDADRVDPADPADPAEKMVPPFVLAADMTVTDALYRMQRAHAAMAIVRDKADKHLGLVTVKDLVEEIVGELSEW